ncbi:15806_t:CDS:1, partial [Racocetra fulgida]
RPNPPGNRPRQNTENPSANQPGPQPNVYYYISYEDYQSLYAKLNFVQSYNIGGVAIADITKDPQIIDFISGNKQNNPGNSTHLPNIGANVGAIVGGIIGSLMFGALVAAGFLLYRRRHKTNNIVTTVVAMFDYVGKEANDLSFKAGDVIE